MAMYETAEALSATRRFVKQAMKMPMLAQDHERDLAIKWRISLPELWLAHE
jgi:RNA polymerase sigma-32 factor